MTTLEDVRERTDELATYAVEVKTAMAERDRTVRECYRAGNGDLKELAEASGLTKQRISQIVLDGRE